MLKMILVINIELHERQAHKPFDDTLESCGMHMCAQKIIILWRHFLGMQKLDLGLGTKIDLQ